MATRSTIKVIRRHNKPVLHLYRHWDGYPEGMAEVLVGAGAETCGDFRLAERIIHVGDCEIISDVNTISDAQFRYTIEELQDRIRITVEDVWNRQISTMQLSDFLSEYAGIKCPKCGKRPRQHAWMDEDSGDMLVEVSCCEPFVGVARTMNAAIALYNRSVVQAREETTT